GGEKQRLALARAFLKRPSIILFDEPTVGLDLRTEQILQRSIATLADTATMITVAHRLYTIQHADRILFMDDGVLVDTGRHEELMARLPQYAEMIDVQRKGGLA
ncbi:ATP-binding cassette domain-containing protein, partial [Paenibacillus tundrae]